MRPAHGIRLQSPQSQMWRPIHRLGDFQRLFHGTRAGAMIAHVEIDQNVHRATGLRAASSYQVT